MIQKSSVPAEMRPPRKLLRAVAELHTRGFQRLRVAVYQYETGPWRCSIAPALLMASHHGAMLIDDVDYDRLANYSSAEGRMYWGWYDRNHCSASALAEVFLQRFPRLAQQGYGQDWLYVGWFQHMLHLTYPDALPVSYIPFQNFDEHMVTLGRKMEIPLPPAGLAAPITKSRR